MDSNKTTRREFIKNTVVAGTALAMSPSLLSCQSSSPYDAKGLPTSILGKTGVEVPRIVIGTGSRFLAVTDEDKWYEILEYGLNNGLYYWDTGAIYKNKKTNEFSEERLGKVLKHRRKEVFLSSKAMERDPEKIKEHIERSLKRLQTDYIDLYQVHGIDSKEDAENATSKGGVFDVLQSYKEQGVIKYIGFTGHKTAEGMRTAAERGDFDTMLIALNHWVQWDGKPEEHVIPVVAKKGLGILAMKTIRPRDDNKEIDPTHLVRYALGLEHVTAAVIGMDSLEVVKSNINILKNYKPLTPEERNTIHGALTPFYKSKDLEWMRPGYIDGHYS